MADLETMERSILDGMLHAGRHGVQDGEVGVVLAERKSRRRFALLAHKGKAAALVERCQAIGVTLPTTPRRVEAHGVAAVWTGPDQWLLLCDAAADVARLDRFFNTVPEAASVVALDDARTVLNLHGPRVRDTLAKMLSIDLHPRAFLPGDAAVTLAGSIPLTIWQLDDAPTYEVAVPRSFARSVVHWLLESAAEYSCMVVRAANGPA